MLMKQFCNIIRPFEIVMISATPGLATLVEPRYIMIDSENSIIVLSLSCSVRETNLQ